MNFKFSILFFALVTITLFSCKDDDPSLEGSYTTTSIVTTGCNEPQDNGTDTYGENGLCETLSSTIEECEVEKINFTNGVVTVTTNYYVNGVLAPAETEVINGTYVVDGDNITLTIDGDITTGTLSIRSNSMTLVTSPASDNCVITINADRD